jgi:glucose/arabinose dehydrogenase
MVVLAGIAVWVFISRYSKLPTPEIPEGEPIVFQLIELTEEVAQKAERVQEAQEELYSDEPVIIAEDLSIPWDVTFLPSGEMLVTERTGNLLIFKDGLQKSIAIPEAEPTGEGGLLGLTLHPDFSSNHFLYLYHTSESGKGLINRVVRYEFKDKTLANPQIIIGNIPGARFHDGGRIRFGPDGKLYITTGDAGDSSSAQDLNSLAGKILRLNDDGSIPEDNPFFDTPRVRTEIWSYGHRNPQGIAWNSEERLWSTEHGRSGVLSGLDELNLIERGANYGWPDSEGDKVLPDTKAPALHSGASVTWAPASVLYWDGSIFFGGLRGETLYEAVLLENRVLELREHFVGTFGRIRAVALGPDGMFYLTTSNRDGRGKVREGDDKIIKINPKIFR